MVKKIITIPTADLSIGDTVRMGFTGCDPNSVSAHHSNTISYLTRPGTQFVNFTYNGHYMAFTSVNVCDGAGAGNIYIQNITQGKTLFTRVNTYFNTNTWYFRWFGEAPTPSYLETLDKLDQWSSAQYIPNSGNKLNL